MKYLVLTNSSEAVAYAQLLISEISRYDVRAQINISEGNSLIAYSESDQEFKISPGAGSIKKIKQYSFDLTIVVGNTFPKKLVKKLRPRSSKICFFQITSDYDEGYKEFKSAVNFFDKVFIDLPYYQTDSKVHHIGSYLFDLIRKHNFSLAEDTSLNIGVMLSERKNLAKLKKLGIGMSKELIDCSWHFVDDSGSNRYGFADKLNMLKNANAVIVDSERASIIAALINCPQISVSGKYGFFGFSKTSKLLVNETLGRDLIASYKPTQNLEIKKELNRVLSDHEYCATMLADYQEFKEKVGTNPVARTAVQILMDWLD